MKVATVEITRFRQAAPVSDYHRARSGSLDQAFFGQTLQDPVHMHRGQTGRVGQLILGHRQFIGKSVAGGVYRVELQREFAKALRPRI